MHAQNPRGEMTRRVRGRSSTADVLPPSPHLDLRILLILNDLDRTELLLVTPGHVIAHGTRRGIVRDCGGQGTTIDREEASPRPPADASARTFVAAEGAASGDGRDRQGYRCEASGEHHRARIFFVWGGVGIDRGDSQATSSKLLFYYSSR
jgi:hypothetical protein